MILCCRLDPIAIQEASNLKREQQNYPNMKNLIKADLLMTNHSNINNKKEAAQVSNRMQEEKRKPTPPDLLELSNMYFGRQQR